MKQPTAGERHRSLRTVSSSVTIPRLNGSGQEQEVPMQVRTFSKGLRHAMFWYALSAAICMTAALTVLAPDLVERIVFMVLLSLATITAVASFLSAHPSIINRRPDTR
jgi:hypothetical protein